MQNTAGPTILKSPDINKTASQISSNPKGFFRRNMIVIIILVLIAAVLAEMVFGVFNLFSPETVRNLNVLSPKVNELSSARLSLIPEKTAYKPGENVVVEVKLYTGGYSTVSTDLVVKYDPQFLKPQGDNAVSVGQIYPEYPPVQLDERQGYIGFSGINFDDKETFSGVGLFAKLNFTALKEGQTDLLIEFKPDDAGESNVVVLESGTKDILGVVDNAKINISKEASEVSEPTNKCGSFTQYCRDGTGTVGTQVCDAGTMNNGVCSYDPRVTSSCQECRI